MIMDWVAALQPYLSKGWYWSVDGKLKIKRRSQPYDTPWLHAPTHIPGSIEAGLDCGILHMFFNQVLNQKGVHSFCMDCYKVVVVPETLDQVKKMAEWQQTWCTEQGWACKVGAEKRNYTQRKWGAYFYCRGKEEGQERYKIVRDWVAENLGKDVKVFLKRACTEFEQALGDSKEWELLPHQEEVEKEFIEKILDYKPMVGPQAEAIQHHVWNVWDLWDKDNQSYSTYHDEEEK